MISSQSEIKTSIDKYIKSHYFISDGRSQTQDLYKTHRGYTQERQKLHNTIIQGILDSANSPKNGEKPIAVLMGGGSDVLVYTLYEFYTNPESENVHLI